MTPEAIVTALHMYHESKLVLSQRFPSKDLDKVASSILSSPVKRPPRRKRGRPKDPHIQAIISQVEQFLAANNREFARHELAFRLKLDPKHISYALLRLRQMKKVQMFGFTGANPRWIHRNFL